MWYINDNLFSNSHRLYFFGVAGHQITHWFLFYRLANYILSWLLFSILYRLHCVTRLKYKILLWVLQTELQHIMYSCSVPYFGSWCDFTLDLNLLYKESLQTIPPILWLDNKSSVGICTLYFKECRCYWSENNKLQWIYYYYGDLLLARQCVHIL